MRIGMISPPWLPVPPPAYGGTEAVIDGLTRGLEQAGHDVILVAHPDSRVPGVELRSVLSRGATVDIGQGATELAHVIAAYDELADVDVIHDHTLSGPLIGPAEPSCPPVIVTHHGHVDDIGHRILSLVAQRCRVVAISQCQADSCPPPVAAVIHHGLDVTEWPMGDGSGGYLLFLGRMVPEKGPHRAIRIARQAGVPLVLAAKMREEPERAFFDAEVRGLLGPQAEYIGEVDAREKRELLRGAIGLLNPIDWPEPFGMVMLEALACGTPVVARSVGAAPEIVGHGQVGFLGRTDGELARGVSRLDEVNRLSCRTWAAQGFSIELMTKRYEEQYGLAIEEPCAA